MSPEDKFEQEDPVGDRTSHDISAESVMAKPDLLFDLIVSEDKTKGWIQARGESPATVTIETVKNFVQEKGISQGLVDNVRMSEYLTRKDFKEKAWLIAKGRSPKPGKDARIEYHFDKDPLKIGTVKATGIIDFKDRGEISQVEKGALLAEKTPLVKEEAGIDIYGQVLPAHKARDVLILRGENTKLSKDGLKVFAAKSGRAVLSIHGELSVYPELEIKGDIGLGTGHVQFKGFINVHGTIQEGFQVRGSRLSTQEIDKADVEVEGDIVVDGGIIGSKVIARGNIKARYIDSSTVEALGDLIVEKEVLHSKIQTNGAFITHQADGKVLSSQISAKKGIKANQIGSDASRPCTLTVGVDPGVESISKRFIDRLTKEMTIKEEEEKKIKGQIDRLRQESNLLSKDMSQMVQIQDRRAIEQRSLKKLVEMLRSKKDLPKLALAERELENLEDRIKATDKPLMNLMDQENQITEKISDLNEASQKLEEAVKSLENEIQAIAKEGEPSVKVDDLIFSGTLIMGEHSSIRLEENYRNVLIRESLITLPDAEEESKTEWRMTISKPDE